MNDLDWTNATYKDNGNGRCTIRFANGEIRILSNSATQQAMAERWDRLQVLRDIYSPATAQDFADYIAKLQAEQAHLERIYSKMVALRQEQILAASTCPDCGESELVCDGTCFPEFIQENPSDNFLGINGAYSHPMDWSPLDAQCPR